MLYLVQNCPKLKSEVILPFLLNEIHNIAKKFKTLRNPYYDILVNQLRLNIKEIPNDIECIKYKVFKTFEILKNIPSSEDKSIDNK